MAVSRSHALPPRPARRAVPWLAAVLSVCTVAIFSVEASDSASTSIRGKVIVLEKDGKPAADNEGVVLFVEGVQLPSRHQDIGNVPRISHRGRQFTPRVLPIVKNTSVDFLNDDSIFHNAFSLSKSKSFDLGIYPEGESKLVQFDRPGLVRVYCNIHPDMTSTILVLNNDYFSVTDADGNYQIQGLPNGEFRLRVWSAYSEEASRVVQIHNGASITEDFRVVQSRKIKKHKNKFGRPYKEKY